MSLKLYVKENFSKNKPFCCKIKNICVNLIQNQRYEVVLNALNRFSGSKTILLKNRRSCK